MQQLCILSREQVLARLVCLLELHRDTPSAVVVAQLLGARGAGVGGSQLAQQIGLFRGIHGCARSNRDPEILYVGSIGSAWRTEVGKQMTFISISVRFDYGMKWGYHCTILYNCIIIILSILPRQVPLYL